MLLRTTALTLSLAVASTASAFDVSNMTDAEREAFGAEVRAYILENPGILMEAANALQAQQAAEQASADEGLVAANLEALTDDGHSWVGGNPEGDITIVEFIDYRCSFCRRAFPDVQELVATDDNVRIIVKEFPILGLQSDLASRFAIAAKIVGGDDAYKTAHDALMAFEGNVS
ncbi:MAG: thioredoxin domain-containing protein, partial [Pseudomonadota bacterium]